jgi:hypothetical protein
MVAMLASIEQQQHFRPAMVASIEQQQEMVALASIEQQQHFRPAAVASEAGDGGQMVASSSRSRAPAWRF